MAKIMDLVLPILSILGYRAFILGSFGGPGSYQKNFLPQRTHHSGSVFSAYGDFPQMATIRFFHGSDHTAGPFMNFPLYGNSYLG